MGRRKFRLVSRKNAEKSTVPTSMEVSIPLPVINPMSLEITIPRAKLPVRDLSSLKTQLHQFLQTSPWTFTTANDAEGALTKLALCFLETGREPPVLRYSVSIQGDFTWTLGVFGRIVDPKLCHTLSGLPQLINSADRAVQFLSWTENCKVCVGNSDPKFMEVAERREGSFKDFNGKSIFIKFVIHCLISLIGSVVVAYVDAVMNPSVPTIRHISCEILLCTQARYDRCMQCSKFRKSLYTFRARQSALTDERLEPDSHTTYASLTSAEKDQRMKRLHDSLKQSERQCKEWQDRLDKVLEERGIHDESIHDDMQAIMEEENEGILEKFPEGSFARLFWQQQYEAATKKDKRGMRWHSLMVKWCLYLRHKSSGAYELLRDSGCIALPSQRTLRDYTHCVDSTIGYSAQVDQHLATVAKIDTCKDYEKCVVLLIDEMYIKEELVYDKHSGSLVGFANLGDINAHLAAFEQSLNKDISSVQSLATTMMMFMVQGLLSSLSYPYAQFSCCNVTGCLLFDPFWEAIFRLERIGFKVHGAYTSLMV